MEREHAESTISGMRSGLRKWPAGTASAERNPRLFDDRLLKIALDRLALEVGSGTSASSVNRPSWFSARLKRLFWISELLPLRVRGSSLFRREALRARSESLQAGAPRCCGPECTCARNREVPQPLFPSRRCRENRRLRSANRLAIHRVRVRSRRQSRTRLAGSPVFCISTTTAMMTLIVARAGNRSPLAPFGRRSSRVFGKGPAAKLCLRNPENCSSRRQPADNAAADRGPLVLAALGRSPPIRRGRREENLACGCG